MDYQNYPHRTEVTVPHSLAELPRMTNKYDGAKRIARTFLYKPTSPLTGASFPCQTSTATSRVLSSHKDIAPLQARGKFSLTDQHSNKQSDILP